MKKNKGFTINEFLRKYYSISKIPFECLKNKQKLQITHVFQLVLIARQRNVDEEIYHREEALSMATNRRSIVTA